MKRAVQLVVHGKVQRVFFRASTKYVADQLKVKGTVQNKEDGTVYIQAEGDVLMVEDFMEWCKQGPDDADVAWVDITESELQGFQNFVVIKKGTNI